MARGEDVRLHTGILEHAGHQQHLAHEVHVPCSRNPISSQPYGYAGRHHFRVLADRRCSLAQLEGRTRAESHLCSPFGEQFDLLVADCGAVRNH